MKYTICGFSQTQLVELGLDLKDTHILRYMLDFMASDRMIRHIHDNKEYVWVKYDAIMETLPILDMSKRAIARRLIALSDKGLLDHYTLKQDGTYSYYRFTDKFYQLLADNPRAVELQKPTPCTQNTQPPDSKVPTGGIQKCVQINSSSIDINLLNIIDFWNSKKIIIHSPETAKQRLTKKHIDTILSLGEEETKKAISTYAQILSGEKYFFKYRWNLWDFIQRGIYKFIDDARPLENFLKFEEKKVDKPEKKRQFEYMILYECPGCGVKTYRGDWCVKCGHENLTEIRREKL